MSFGARAEEPPGGFLHSPAEGSPPKGKHIGRRVSLEAGAPPCVSCTGLARPHRERVIAPCPRELPWIQAWRYPERHARRHVYRAAPRPFTATESPGSHGPRP